MIDPLDVALGEVPPQERAEVARRLREDRRFREEVERLAPVVARLEREPAEVFEAPEPPPLVVGAPLPLRRRRRPRMAFVLRPSVAIAASAGFVAAGLGLGALLGGGGGGGGGDRAPLPGPPAGERRVALTALPGKFGRAELIADGGGRVRLVARGLKPARRGHHELWLLPAEGDPVPVGTFKVGPDGRATATYRLPRDPDRYALFDVSEEPADGNPKHSGRSILQAPTRS